eukprot:4811959-Amphidinium_carterae.1
MVEIILSLGQGLRGLLPKISGTMVALSVWENGLEGHLPNVHLSDGSVLFVHANKFSCELPHFRGAQQHTTAGLALVGNHFVQPRQLPPWVTAIEQPSDMFCVSNQQSMQLVKLLLYGTCFLTAVCIICFSVRHPCTEVEALQGLHQTCDHRRFVRARSAWYETSQHLALFAWTACALLPLYSNMIPLACCVVSDHLRFHFAASTRRLAACYLVLMGQACIYLFTARFQKRQALRLMSQGDSIELEDTPSKPTRWAVRFEGSRVDSSWFLACVLTSTPGVLYSAVKAVPGFLEVT